MARVESDLAANRFVAYAFSMGDAFFEFGRDLTVHEAEGALTWVGLANRGAVVGEPIVDLFHVGDRKLLLTAIDSLATVYRLGPLHMRCGKGADTLQVAAFLSRLPEAPDRYFLSLCCPQRLGIAVAPVEGGEDDPALGDVDSFLIQLKTLIESETSDESMLLVTLLTMADGEDVSDESREALTQHLAAYSLDGKSAADLGDDRYAIIHEHDGQDDPSGALLERIETATGLSMASASLPVDKAILHDGDRAKAMVYCIRQFAAAADNFNVTDLAEDYRQRIESAKARVATFRQIIDDQRFSLMFQPIVDLATRQVHHVEALARFDVRAGAGSPFEQIAFAEDAGLIAEFDHAVLTKTIKKLRTTAGHPGAPGIAVNVSGRSLSSPAFTTDLLKILHANRSLSPRLLLEVTESARIATLDQLAPVFAGIRELGFALCLDDFGAGASSYHYLRTLPVDYVKIDGSYVRDAPTDRDCAAFLRSMVTLCQELGLRTVGEWIETDAQAAFLAKLGVEFGQGYLFGRPSAKLQSGPVRATA